MEEEKARVASASTHEYPPESWHSQVKTFTEDGQGTKRETKTVKTVIISGGTRTEKIHTTTHTTSSGSPETVEEEGFQEGRPGDKQEQVTVEGLEGLDKCTLDKVTSIIGQQEAHPVDSEEGKMEATQTEHMQGDGRQACADVKQEEGDVEQEEGEVDPGIHGGHVVTVVSEVETTVERTYFLTNSGREEIVEEKEIGKTSKTRYHVDELGRVVDSDGCEVTDPKILEEMKKQKDSELAGNLKEFDEKIKTMLKQKSLTESGQDDKAGQSSAGNPHYEEADVDVVEGKVMAEKLSAMEEDQGHELFGSCVLIKSHDLVDFMDYPVQEWVYISQDIDTKEITEHLLMLSTELYHKGRSACIIL